MDAWLSRVRDLRSSNATPDVERLAAALQDVVAEHWLGRARFDDAAPYGRTVLAADDGLEVMIAAWTRNRPCAPHDHGPGQGAVRVLQGRARHRGFALREGELVPGPDEVLEAGAVLRCHRRWIHQMQDDGDALPLITLHLYVGATTPMTVYDLDHRRTQWLGPGCGAWPHPTADPAVLRWAWGFEQAGT